MQGGKRTECVINVQTLLKVVIILKKPNYISHYELLLAALAFKKAS